MQAPPTPPNETQRLAKLHSYAVLDTLPEESFDRITRIAADILDVPIALVSLIDSGRQWFKSKVGLDADETPRELSFCGHAILGHEIFEIPDATKDERFFDNPLVTGAPTVRFYAGAPLHTPDGQNIGTLCAIDNKPRTLNQRQRQLLVDLSHVIVDELELRIALKESMEVAAGEVNLRALQNEFVSAVTHELRTPLTSIQGSLRLIEAGAFGPIDARLKDAVAIASRNSVTLLNLINDLLDFQKLSDGRMEFNFEPASSANLLRETCEDMTGYMSGKGVTIDSVIDDDAVFLADKSAIAQVLTNLLSNAAKFSPKGALVRAVAARDDRSVLFSVSDTGPGIPAEFQGRIFQKFARAKGQAAGTGTGLGLAISKIIVEAHRGSIRFDTSPNGTTFHVALPLRQSLA